MTKCLFALAAAAVVGLGSSAMAQRTLQWDVNNLQFQARDSSGAPSAFGGLTHTGSVTLTDLVPPTELASISIRSGPGNPFIVQPGGPWNLTDVSMTISLNAGMVTGGSFSLDLNGGPGSGGDRYTAAIGNAGSITPFVGGGYKVEGLTTTGNFSDGSFGSVDVSDFFSAQGGTPGLIGSFLSFRINPDPNGASIADLDAFVTVPSPGTMACLGIAGLFFAPRRRR
jgi:hypothetical protein